jgi:hypothetical protein
MRGEGPSVLAAVAVAVPLGIGLGYLAWRVRRLRPLLTPIFVSAMTWSYNQFLAARRNGQRERRLDEAVEESFPASDPPAIGR